MATIKRLNKSHFDGSPTATYEVVCQGISEDKRYVLTMIAREKWGDSHRKISYTLYDGNCFLFAGCDYSVPNGKNPVGYFAAIQLLGWLTLKVDDTDSDYFKNYTGKQLAWTTSQDGEDISCLVSDYEEFLAGRIESGDFDYQFDLYVD